MGRRRVTDSLGRGGGAVRRVNPGGRAGVGQVPLQAAWDAEGTRVSGDGWWWGVDR